MLRCAMLCCAMLFCAMLCVPDATFSGINVTFWEVPIALSGSVVETSGSAAETSVSLPEVSGNSPAASPLFPGVIIFLFVGDEIEAIVYRGTFAAFGTEEILPLYPGTGQHTALSEERDIKNAIFSGKCKNTLYVLRGLVIEVGGDIFVKERIGENIVAFTTIDAGECAHQGGKRAVAFAFHYAANQAIL